MDKDPDYTGTSPRFSWGHIWDLTSVQGQQTGWYIRGSQNIVIRLPYLEKQYYGFDIAGINITTPCNVAIHEPRYAAIGDATDGCFIRASTYAQVSQYGGLAQGVVPVPYSMVDSTSIINVQNLYSIGAEGYGDGLPVSTIGTTGSGSAGNVALSGAKFFVMGGKSTVTIATMTSSLMPGETALFVASVSPSPSFNNGGQVRFSAPSPLVFTAGQIGRITRMPTTAAGFKYYIEKLPC